MKRGVRIALVFLPLWGLYFWTLAVQGLRKAMIRRGQKRWTVSAVLVLLRLQASRETLHRMKGWANR